MRLIEKCLPNDNDAARTLHRMHTAALEALIAARTRFVFLPRLNTHSLTELHVQHLHSTLG